MPEQLLGPPILAFLIAGLATLARFDVRLPEPLPPILSAFLLLAIGLKGGRSLAATGPVGLARPLLAALAVGIVTPLVAFAVLRGPVGLPRLDAAAVAAHYGSVSVVTFVVVLAELEALGITVEGLMAGLLAVLEVVGVVVGLALARRSGAGTPWSATFLGLVRGRSVAYLLIGMSVGSIAGEARLASIDPFFVGLFEGALVLFLLEMGALAASNLRRAVDVGPRLVAAAIAIPVVNGGLGALLGALAGLSTGGVAVLAVLAASASYIVAPAAVRMALPEADPSLSMTMALGITFPFNVLLGIPLFLWMAQRLT